ncbi:hypothetical protein R9C00_23070 [Flammeovirgaceae bacterium SG7u.111]|nr:hypothetical protein [Flammeovirgaceae bacterium SG7u.132]WPO34587.1 hypothetical protein R9C00_23070 [Flammeovirgaceae bacterium SG7u.111]
MTNKIFSSLLFLLLCCFSQLAAQSVVLPKPTDKEQYIQLRNMLKATDSARAFDADVILSPTEQRVNQKLVALRKEMIAGYKAQHFTPPARYFYQSQEYMLNTKLFGLLEKMPKGGIMHVHSSAMGDFHWIVDKAATQDDCYVFWEENNEKYVKGQLQFFKKKDVPKGFESVKKLAKKHKGFKEELYDLLTFDERIDGDSVDIWLEFEHSFQRISGFTRYQPMFKAYHTDALKIMAADGAQHVEVREIPIGGLYDLNHEKGAYYTSDTIIRYWKDMEMEVQKEYPDFSLQIVYCFLRFMNNEQVLYDLENAYRLRKQYPDFIAAYDLVAEEDAGHSTFHFLDTWMKIDSLNKVYGTDMPLCLHDGESDWESVDNLYDAFLLRSHRIGHGFNLFKFSVLQDLARQNDVSIEISPLSNQILGYVRDLRIHPATYYMSQGIQISLSPDDPAIFGYRGITPDYWAAFIAWELDLKSLKKIARNALTYSNLPTDKKQAQLEVFEQKWQEWVVFLDGEL